MGREGAIGFERLARKRREVEAELLDLKQDKDFLKRTLERDNEQLIKIANAVGEGDDESFNKAQASYEAKYGTARKLQDSALTLDESASNAKTSLLHHRILNAQLKDQLDELLDQQTDKESQQADMRRDIMRLIEKSNTHIVNAENTLR